MGRDKARLDWQGRPLWQAQLDKLRALQPARLLVACREEQGLHQPPVADVEWLFDPAGDDSGPLGAIERALTAAALPLLVLAVDLPAMPAAFLDRGLRTPAEPGRSRFFATAQGLEPLAGWYDPALLPLLQEALARRELGLQRLILRAAGLGLAALRQAEAGEAAFFANANTPGEWAHEKGRSADLP